jgi:hypothetical protein
MREARFRRLLDRRGPHPERWAEAEAAAALLARSAAARAALAEAVALDRALRQGLPAPGAAAVARLQDGVTRAIARAPLPAAPGLWGRLWAGLVRTLRPAAPAGWGALAATASVALWLEVAPPAAEEPLPVLTSLPLPGDTL